MSDSEPDPELLELLRQHLRGKLTLDEEPETGVLEGAEYVYDNSIDVALDMRATKNAAAFIYDQMQQKEYSTETWAEHELHPKAKNEKTVAFIFTMDLLNLVASFGRRALCCLLPRQDLDGILELGCLATAGIGRR